MKLHYGKIGFVLLWLVLHPTLVAQVSTNEGIFFAKEFSKEISLYKAKEFVIREVLNVSEDIVKFEIDALAATSSGELTSLVYRCDSQDKEGLILGFYGYYWNEAGVVFEGYGFKNLQKEEATHLLNKIGSAIDDNAKYLTDDPSDSNVCFKHHDFTILITTADETRRIRIFWKDFDADWGFAAFQRTKKRFEKSLK